MEKEEERARIEKATKREHNYIPPRGTHVVLNLNTHAHIQRNISGSICVSSYAKRERLRSERERERESRREIETEHSVHFTIHKIRISLPLSSALNRSLATRTYTHIYICLDTNIEADQMASLQPHLCVVTFYGICLQVTKAHTRTDTNSHTTHMHTRTCTYGHIHTHSLSLVHV